MTKSVFERIDSLMKQQGKQQKEMNNIKITPTGYFSFAFFK